MSATDPQSAQEPEPLVVAMVLYADMTLLDLVGPQCVLGMHSRTHLVAETLDPILTDSGVSILPTTTYAGVPDAVDVLFVPGGAGTLPAMSDPKMLAFLADRAPRARYVTSVCTGSLILGAAGLLDGYRAATHWAFYPALAALGVEGVQERVVVDRNRVTGGGVTAGIDFGLTLLAKLRGEAVARATQLGIEYDPDPPYDCGHPRNAGRDLTAMVTASVQSGIDATVAVASAIRRRATEQAA